LSFSYRAVSAPPTLNGKTTVSATQVECLTVKNPSKTFDISAIINKMPNITSLKVKNSHAHIEALNGIGKVEKLEIDSQFKRIKTPSAAMQYPMFSTKNIVLKEFSFKGNGNIVGKITTDLFSQHVYDNASLDENNADLIANFHPLFGRDRVMVKTRFDTFVTYATFMHYDVHHESDNSWFDFAITNVDHPVLDPGTLIPFSRFAGHKTRYIIG
jgi:hypothetical protein